MIQHCCVRNCQHSRKTSSCTFKRFPSDPQKSNLWETLVKRAVDSTSGPGGPEWKRTPWDRICECHFDDDQYEKNRPDGVSKLRWDAVPHLFGESAKTPQHRLSGNPVSKMRDDKDQGTSVIQGPFTLGNEGSPPQVETSVPIDMESGGEGYSGGNTVEAQSDLTSIEGRDIANMDTQRVVDQELADAEATNEENCLDEQPNSCEEGESDFHSREAGCVGSSVIVAPGGQPTEDCASSIQDDDNFCTRERTVLYSVHNVASGASYEDVDDPGIVDMNDTVETPHEERVMETPHEERIMETLNEDGVIETLYEEGVMETSHEEGVMETLHEEGIIETPHTEGVYETLHVEGVIETPHVEGLIETPHEEGVIETPLEEKVIETPHEGVIETPHEEGVMETPNEEGVMEPYEEGVIETPHEEGIMETLHEEGAIETLHEGVIETLQGGVIEIPHEEGPIETLLEEGNIGTLHEEGVIGTQLEEGTIETPHEDRAFETIHEEQVIETSHDQIIETLHDDGIIETLHEERVIETPHVDGVIETLHEEEVISQGNEQVLDDNKPLDEDDEYSKDEVTEEGEDEDALEYGEEIEVEIEDCSDGEMEQDEDGGVTYIITEDMIVVEEPESPHQSKETGDGTLLETNQRMCDEQTTASQRTKRFLVKVPASRPGSADGRDTAEIEISEVGDSNTSSLTIENVNDSTTIIASEMPDMTLEKDHDNMPIMNTETADIEPSKPIEEMSVKQTSEVSADGDEGLALDVFQGDKEPALDDSQQGVVPSSEIEDAVERQMGVLHSGEGYVQETTVCHTLEGSSHSDFEKGSEQPSEVQGNHVSSFGTGEDSLEVHVVEVAPREESLGNTLQDEVDMNKTDSISKPDLVTAQDQISDDLTTEDKSDSLASSSGRSSKLRLIDSKHTNYTSGKSDRRKSIEIETNFNVEEPADLSSVNQKDEPLSVAPQGQASSMADNATDMELQTSAVVNNTESEVQASLVVDNTSDIDQENFHSPTTKDLANESDHSIILSAAAVTAVSAVITSSVTIASGVCHEKAHSKQKSRQVSVEQQHEDVAENQLSSKKTSSSVKDIKLEVSSPKKVKTGNKEAKRELLFGKKTVKESQEITTDVKPSRRPITDRKEINPDAISVKMGHRESKADTGRSRKGTQDRKERKSSSTSAKKATTDKEAKDVLSKNVVTDLKESKRGSQSPKKSTSDGKETKSHSPKKPISIPTDLVTRSSHSGKHAHSKSSSPRKTSHSSSPNHKSKPAYPESPSKDRKASSKDASPKKQSHSASSVAVTRREEKISVSKSSLRSVRHRKIHSETSRNAELSASEPPQSSSKRERVKANEKVLPSRHSERVCRATEKAIASGILSKRSRPASRDSAAKDSEKSPAYVPAKKSKKKGEAAALVSDSEESPSRRRRSMRSSDSSAAENGSGSSEQTLGPGRKVKAVKRKGSPISLPLSKHMKSEDQMDAVFIANIPKMCRVCGSENEHLLNVMGPEGKSLRLADKIHNILPIKIVEKEPLPTGVCHTCVVTLIACERLVEKSSQIDKQLRQHFKCPADKEPPSVVPEQELSIPIQTVVSQAIPIELSNIHPKDTSIQPSTSASSEIIVYTPVELQPEVSAATPQHDLLLLLEASEIVSVTKNGDSEDCPPVLEAEPPSSQVQGVGEEIPTQPPILVPQPAKPLPELMPIDDSTSPMKRFGNTYKSRIAKQGQSEKLEAGAELLIGECFEEDIQGEPVRDESESSVQPMEVTTGTITTEEFHIVDLEMNVEEIPADDVEEDAMPSSPKSVVDSILVDWSGDEDDNGGKPVTSNIITITPTSKTEILSEVVSIADLNGTPIIVQPVRTTKAPCLFIDEEDVDDPKPKTSKARGMIDSKSVKQESFWPDPDPTDDNQVTAEKHPNDVPWKCSVCGKRGKSISRFLEHKKLHLNDRKLVSCPKCSESFSNSNLLKSHMKVHDGDDVDDDVALEERLAKQRVLTRRRPIIASGSRETIVDVDLTPDDDGLYHCSLCQNAFTNIESLCQHKLIHQQNKDAALYRCGVCRRTFFQNKDYQDHMTMHQPGTKKTNAEVFQCSRCDLKLGTQKEFIEHINTHITPIGGDNSIGPNADSLACDICQKKFDTRGKLRTHRSTVHKATAYACHLCDKVCQKRITLIEHLRKHTGDNPFACPVCDKRFNRLANYKAHMMIHENARRYECPFCGKRFNRQSIQQRHIKTHTNEHPRKHRCRVCNLCFALATEMFNHRKLHTRDEVERANWEDEKQRMALTSFACKVCQVAFKSVEAVLSHMKDHTDDERDIAVKLKNPRLECDICGKILNSKRTFNNHRSSHIDGKPYVCKICQKGYATSTGLNYHMLSHTGERPFPCTFCNKGYKNSTDLKVHMRQHTGEFPYKCNMCNKAFRSASSLQKHGFVHSEERPHSCQYCGMCFKRESTKINHERIHTNDRRYKCKVCSRSFIQKGACDAHEKLHFRGNSGTIYVRAVDNTSEVINAQSATAGSSSTAASSTAVTIEKQDMFDDFEEEDIDEDDDEDDEYIIYEDDSVDGDEEEMDADNDSQPKSSSRDPLKGGSQKSLGGNIKSTNGVSMQGTSITPVPVTEGNDAVPSAGDTSVHITIL